MSDLKQRMIEDMQLRTYFLYLKNQKRLARATTTIALCGIKFFFATTLKRDWTTMNIPRPLPRRLAKTAAGGFRDPPEKGLATGLGCAFQTGGQRRTGHALPVPLLPAPVYVRGAPRP